MSMTRTIGWVVLVALLATTVAVAQHHETGAGEQAAPPPAPARGGMMGGGMMGGGMMGGGMMMGPPALAVGGPHLFMLQGGKLSLLTSDLEIAKSVELPPAPESTEAGEAPQAGHAPGAGPGPGPQAGPSGGGMMGGGMMGGGMMGGGMMGGGMMRGGPAALAANDSRVYVLRGGVVHAFDHDLNLLQSKRVSPEAAMCPMCGQMMGRARAEGEDHAAHGETAGMRESTRPVTGGVVNLHLRPGATGEQPWVHVWLASHAGEVIPSATFNVYVYPPGQTQAGKQVELRPVAAGGRAGYVRLESAPPWEIAVRVMRPGQADEVVYFSVPAP